MTCRRKTKKERELAADINKAYGIFCQKHSLCYGCEYDEKVDCKKAYMLDLMKMAVNLEDKEKE